MPERYPVEAISSEYHIHTTHSDGEYDSVHQPDVNMRMEDDVGAPDIVD
jgi:hypothetical protein